MMKTLVLLLLPPLMPAVTHQASAEPTVTQVTGAPPASAVAAPVPATASESAPVADSAAKVATAPRRFLKYGEEQKKGEVGYIGLGPMGGATTNSGGALTKRFSLCSDGADGKAVCGSSEWIGMFGGRLAEEVAGVPEAEAAAKRIRTTTWLQFASFAALPVFLYSAFDLAHGPKDEFGDAEVEMGAGSVTMLVLAGAAFANCVGWNLYEGALARRAVRTYNANLDLRTRLDAGGGGLELGYRF